MFNEFDAPETDEEFRHYKNQRFQEVAFEAKKVLVAAERQIAALGVLVENNKGDPTLFKKSVRHARKAGKAEQEAEFLEYFRESLEHRRMIDRRIKKLKRVCGEMQEVLRQAKLRGSDA